MPTAQAQQREFERESGEAAETGALHLCHMNQSIRLRADDGQRFRRALAARVGTERAHCCSSPRLIGARARQASGPYLAVSGRIWPGMPVIFDIVDSHGASLRRGDGLGPHPGSVGGGGVEVNGKMINEVVCSD